MHSERLTGDAEPHPVHDGVRQHWETGRHSRRSGCPACSRLRTQQSGPHSVFPAFMKPLTCQLCQGKPMPLTVLNK